MTREPLDFDDRPTLEERALVARLAPAADGTAPPSHGDLAAWLDRTLDRDLDGDLAGEDTEAEFADLERRLAASGIALDGLDVVREEVRRHEVGERTGVGTAASTPVPAEAIAAAPTPGLRLVPAGPAAARPLRHRPAAGRGGAEPPPRLGVALRWSLAAAAALVACVLGWQAGSSAAPPPTSLVEAGIQVAERGDDAREDRDGVTAIATDTQLASVTFGAVGADWGEGLDDLFVDFGALATAATRDREATR